MRGLLDAPLLRLVKILEILIYSDSWLATKQIAQQIGYTEKTVSRDINLLKKRWGDLLDLEISPKLGIKIHNQNVAVMGRVFNELFNESLALKWLKEIFLNPRKNAEYFESRLFTSQSTLNRLLPKLNRILNPIGFSIINDKKKYYVSGENEVYIRKFYATFFIELYGVNLEKLPFNFKIDNFYEIITKDIFKNFPFKDEVSIMFFIMYYIVSLIRESQGFTIVTEYPSAYKISNRHFSYIQSILPDIKRENLEAIHQFIASQVIDGWDSLAEERLVKKEAKVLLDHIFIKFQFNPSAHIKEEMEAMLCQLYFSYKAYPFEHSILFNRINYFAMSFRKTNPKAYLFLENELSQFSEKIGVDVASLTTSLIYWLHIIYPKFHDYSGSKQVLVISDFGQPHAEFLRQRLLAMYDKELDRAMDVDAVSYSSFLNQTPEKKYDIIATTIPLLPIQHDNIVLINDYPGVDDFCVLFSKLQESDISK